jgi:hypothetical protein
MSKAVILLNFVSLAGLVFTALMGYVLGAELIAVAGAGGATFGAGTLGTVIAGALGRHLVFALGSVLMALVGESMVLAYFLGKSASVERTVAAHDLDHGFVDRMGEFRQRASKLVLLSLLLLIAVLLFGGGVVARSVPAWTHQVVAWAAIGVHGLSSFFSARALGDHGGLLAELDELVRGVAAGGGIEARRTTV